MSQYLDEGYIKFDIQWDVGEAPNHPLMDKLKTWRDKMYNLGLIGFYEKFQVGYGNISIKTEKGIIVSGTQTGHIPQLGNRHYTLVDEYDIDKNSLHCIGPVKASSESLTHAAIYECSKDINAIIHIHHKSFWENTLNIIPTSSNSVPYGTPEMAYEIFRLYKETDFSKSKIMAMAGHDEGIIAFGNSLEEAGEIIEKYFIQFVK